MDRLEEIVARLPRRHRMTLQWFIDRAGEEQQWPEPLTLSGEPGLTLLASKAKGIYKPKWSEYALSIRQSLGGPYPDREPMFREDGTWLYAYFQENEELQARDEEYTNRGMIACWRDRVPVGVMRQVSGKPNVRYKILGIALVASWEGGYFFLEGFSRDGLSRGTGPRGRLDLLSIVQESRAVESGSFDLKTLEDARERMLASIVLRRGQPAFRAALLEIFGGKCAISGCDAVDALEAAHITPYRGEETNHPGNGILLRADLHTLFDLGLITIKPATCAVRISEILSVTTYGNLDGQHAWLPEDDAADMRTKNLERHLLWSGL